MELVPFKVFGMTRPEIEPATSRSQSERSTNRATMPVRHYLHYADVLVVCRLRKVKIADTKMSDNFNTFSAEKLS